MAMSVTVPRYTVDDLEQFPDDGNRYELLDGVLLVTPQAKAVHQRIASRLQTTLAVAVERPGLGAVVGPGAVVRPPGTQLQPDILVYPARFGLTTDWPDVTEHWLAIEVLSRSSRVYDRLFKRDAYFVLGVQQVWIVDILDKSVEVWRSRTDCSIARDVIHWSVPTTSLVLTIDLVEVFAGIP